jgi:hypothetical protein
VWHGAAGPSESSGTRTLYACDGRPSRTPWTQRDWCGDHGLSLPAPHRVCERPPHGTWGRRLRSWRRRPRPSGPPPSDLQAPGNSARYSHGAKHQGQRITLQDTDGFQCSTDAPALCRRPSPFGQATYRLYCEEGSISLGDFSALDPDTETPQSVRGSQIARPPAYWGVSTPSGRTYLKVHPRRRWVLLARRSLES